MKFLRAYTNFQDQPSIHCERLLCLFTGFFLYVIEILTAIFTDMLQIVLYCPEAMQYLLSGKPCPTQFHLQEKYKGA